MAQMAADGLLRKAFYAPDRFRIGAANLAVERIESHACVRICVICDICGFIYSD